MTMPTVTGFFPKPQVIARLPEIGLQRLESCISSDVCLADRHNAFTDYCIGLLFCCTGHRAVWDPFSELSHFDLDRGLLLICDKVSDESRAWRMVGLPDMAAKQVSIYRNYLRLLASKLQGCSTRSEFPAQVWELSEGSKQMPLFFYLRESGDGWDPVTPATLSKRWQDRWQLPVNILRHVMADTLLDLTQRADWVSIQLGHTDGVDHPFGSTSTNSVLDTLGQIRPFLEVGLKKRGWAVARSPLHGSRIKYRPEKQKVTDTSATVMFGYQQREAKRQERRSIAVEFFRYLWRQHFSIDAPLDREAVEHISEQIIVQAPAAGHSVNWCLTLLYRYVGYRPGGRAVLRQIARYRRIEIEPSPFHAESLADYQAVQDVRSAFLDYLTQQGRIHGPFDLHTRLAEIVVSAAIFGGVANADRLKVLAKALLAHSYNLQGVMFVDVPLGHGAVFRWFPDSVSRRLIQGLFCAAVPDQTVEDRRVKKALHSLARTMSGSSSKCPYRWFAQISSAAAVMELPGYISACLSGDIPAVSLPLPQWVRVVTGEALVSDDDSQTEKDSETDIWSPPMNRVRKRSHTAGEGRIFLRELSRLISAARNAKRVGNQLARTRAKRELAKTLQQACASSNWSTLQMMLVAWTVHLCQHGTLGKRNLAYATVEKYAVLVASRLLPVSENIDVYAMDELAYEELYLRAVEREKPVRRFELASRLREAHSFFREVYLLEDVDWSAIMGAAGGRAEMTFADANVVTSAEYRRSLTAIISETSLGERRRWQYAALLLFGFRFGFRFGEALRLRFTDVQRDENEIYIWVHNSVFGETKSNAGVRIVALIELLDEQEKQVLDQLLAAGEADFHDNPGAILMADSSGATELVDRAEAGHFLNSLLRRVTGDSSLRYHHLRHGWVTRAVATQAGLRYQAFCEQPSENAWSEFFGDDAGFPLRSIAVGAGHAHESTTLASYTHCVDQLAQGYSPNAQLTDHAIAYSEQVPYATIRSRRRNGRTAEGKPLRIPKPAVATQTPLTPVLRDLVDRRADVPSRPRLTEVDLLLRRFRDSGKPIDAVAKALGMDLFTASDILNRAIDIEINSGYDAYCLVERSGDPIAVTVKGRNFSQFLLENAVIKEQLIRIDEKLQTLRSDEKEQIIDGLQVWARTTNAGTNFCDLARAEQLISMVTMCRFLKIHINAFISSEANPDLCGFFQSIGLNYTVREKATFQGIRIELLPGSGPVRTLLRLLFILKSGLTVK